jgi:transcription-repair coupling factor (superfamily II helicase)
MEAVGIDYYLHLLERTVREQKGEMAVEVKSKINLNVNIRIPDDYLPQTNLRLTMYKRISSMESIEDIERIRNEIEDRFGPLPLPVQNLLQYGVIKILAQKLRIKSIDRVGQKAVLKFYPTTTVDLARMSALLENHDGSINPDGVMHIKLSSPDDQDFLNETNSILMELSGM